MGGCLVSGYEMNGEIQLELTLVSIDGILKLSPSEEFWPVLGSYAVESNTKRGSSGRMEHSSRRGKGRRTYPAIPHAISRDLVTIERDSEIMMDLL